jgi:hypothetical protein
MHINRLGMINHVLGLPPRQTLANQLEPLPSLLFLRQQVQPGEQPDEAYAVFQYTVYDLRTPLIDDQGNKSRKVQIEQSRFLQDPDTKLWRFADYKLVEVPEALAKTAEMQAKDMAAAGRAAVPVAAADGEQQ